MRPPPLKSPVSGGAGAHNGRSPRRAARRAPLACERGRPLREGAGRAGPRRLEAREYSACASHGGRHGAVRGRPLAGGPPLHFPLPLHHRWAYAASLFSLIHGGSPDLGFCNFRHIHIDSRSLHHGLYRGYAHWASNFVLKLCSWYIEQRHCWIGVHLCLFAIRRPIRYLFMDAHRYIVVSSSRSSAKNLA